MKFVVLTGHASSADTALTHVFVLYLLKDSIVSLQ